jgi:UDP-N-acetylmuramate dehydrogenase
MFNLITDHPLESFNTFHIKAIAGTFIEFDDKDKFLSWLRITKPSPESVLVLGGGSNLLLAKDIPGIVLHPVNDLIEVVGYNPAGILVRAGAGTVWDRFVEWCLERNYVGLENLSLIPGSVGASPIQNIGAYGTEAGNLVESVEVIDLEDGRNFILSSEQCRFGYRDSIFKHPEGKHWLVWSVTYRLQKEPLVNLCYEPLKKYFSGHPSPTLQDVREAVIAIRRSKLPDPEEIGSAGSFFKNPVIPLSEAADLKKEYPELPFYPQDRQTVKVSAGWLIEQCGWKGFREGPVGVYPAQALVLVNYGGATAAQIIALSERIVSTVQERFGIQLENEVRIL